MKTYPLFGAQTYLPYLSPTAFFLGQGGYFVVRVGQVGR